MMAGIRMPQDWQIAAYEAALRRDHDAMCATLEELAALGRDAMQDALHAWMDRTEYVLTTIAATKQTPVGFVLEADNGGGEDVDVDQAPPWVAWAGRMFVAHLAEDDDQCEALWSALPDDDVHDALYAALRMMVLTAENLAETLAPLTARPSQRPDPMTGAARLARAHLN